MRAICILSAASLLLLGACGKVEEGSTAKDKPVADAPTSPAEVEAPKDSERSDEAAKKPDEVAKKPVEAVKKPDEAVKKPVEAPRKAPGPVIVPKGAKALPVDFPAVTLNAAPGQAVAIPYPQDMMESFEASTFKEIKLYGGVLVEEGPHYSKVRTNAGSDTHIPNALIMPLGSAARAEVGDRVFRCRGELRTTCGRLTMNERLVSGMSPNRYTTLRGAWQPGTFAACVPEGKDVTDNPKDFKKMMILNRVGEDLIGPGWSDKLMVARTSRCVPIVPGQDFKEGQKVYVAVLADFIEGKVVGQEEGRVKVAYKWVNETEKLFWPEEVLTVAPGPQSVGVPVPAPVERVKVKELESVELKDFDIPKGFKVKLDVKPGDVVAAPLRPAAEQLLQGVVEDQNPQVIWALKRGTMVEPGPKTSLVRDSTGGIARIPSAFIIPMSVQGQEPKEGDLALRCSWNSCKHGPYKLGRPDWESQQAPIRDPWQQGAAVACRADASEKKTTITKGGALNLKSFVILNVFGRKVLGYDGWRLMMLNKAQCVEVPLKVTPRKGKTLYFEGHFSWQEGKMLKVEPDMRVDDWGGERPPISVSFKDANGKEETRAVAPYPILLKLPRRPTRLP